MKLVIFISFLIASAGILPLTSTVDVAITSRQLTPFTAVKSVDNDYVCAFFPGLQSTVMTTTPQICGLECYRDSSCGGFNLRDNDTTCELFGIQPLFTVTRGCRHFAVRVFSQVCNLHLRRLIVRFQTLTRKAVPVGP
jgi:hypothetical protein